MPSKQESPLLKAQKEGDTLKKKADAFYKEYEDHVKRSSTDRNATKALYEKCSILLSNAEILHKKATKLKLEDEPVMIENFRAKQQDEVKRVENIKQTLYRISTKLNPNTSEKGKVQEDIDAEESTGEEGTDDSEEDSEEESAEDEEETPRPGPSKQSVSGGKRAGPEGRKVQVQQEETEEDSEEETEAESEGVEEEESGEEEETEEEETDEEETEEESEEESDSDGQATGTMRQYEALADFDGQSPEDLPFREGDILTIHSTRKDGWLEAENAEGQRGLVPITYLQLLNKYKDVETPREGDGAATSRSGKELWKSIKQAVKETSVTDVLQAMGAVPSGFRESTLAKCAAKDEYGMRECLTPKLSPSCVSYADLFYDSTTKMIRLRATRILRIVTLVACRQIPQPGAGLEIRSRHVRICLFDGKNMLSNVHTVRVSHVDKDQRTWTFSTKVLDQMRSIEFGELFVRSNQTHENIGLLFELCISYYRPSTEQGGEFSCGWAHLPLFENDHPVQNKSFDLYVNGGTPFEKGVDVDPSAGRQAGTSKLRSLIAGNKQPRLVVRLTNPTKEQKDLLDTLPDVILSSTTYIQYLSFYRQILTDSLLRDTADIQSIEPVHSPVLSMFPSVADHSDLMDVLRSAWADKLRTAKRAEKRDQSMLKEWFKRVFLESVYPLHTSASLPAQKFGDIAVEEARRVEMQRLLALNKAKGMLAGCLLAADAAHTPFDTAELAFSVIGPHSLTPHHSR